MSAQTPPPSYHCETIDISAQGPELDALSSAAETQRRSNLLRDFDSDSKETGIAPLGLNNFLYNATLLFLPYFYSSRTYLVLRAVKLAEKEINSNYDCATAGRTLVEVKTCWNDFLDSVISEWTTLNVVSALLLTAIYNVLQLGGYGSSLSQCTALMSLVSALMSLIFGCLYLIRFGTMRRPHKAMKWGLVALKNSGNTLWNVYILLALPSVWLAWSLILFVICLMSIVWQSIGPTNVGSTSNLGPLPLAVKLSVSAVLLFGMVHLSLILATFSRYGSRLDQIWSEALRTFVDQGKSKGGGGLTLQAETMNFGAGSTIVVNNS